MAWLLFAVCAVCKVLNIVCGLLSWRLHIRRLHKDDPQTRLDNTLTDGETRNGPTGSNVESTTDQALGISNPATQAETADL